jgi:hypothetical protein
MLIEDDKQYLFQNLLFNSEAEVSSINDTDSENSTALVLALKNKNVKITKYLCKIFLHGETCKKNEVFINTPNKDL